MVEEQAPWEYQRALIIIPVFYCVGPGEGERTCGEETREEGEIREKRRGRGGWSWHAKYCKYREGAPGKWREAKRGWQVGAKGQVEADMCTNGCGMFPESPSSVHQCVCLCKHRSMRILAKCILSQEDKHEQTRALPPVPLSFIVFAHHRISLSFYH